MATLPIHDDVKRFSSWQLPLFGPARLERDGQPLDVPRKGLGILYRLALEGPARRETLADLLWDSVNAMQSLRVELHRLRTALRAAGTEVRFERDTLRLPDGIVLSDAGPAGEALDGLDGLTDAFDAWLRYRRLRLHEQHSGRPAHHERLARLARDVPSSGAVILTGPPGLDAEGLALELARALQLPLVDGLGDGRARRAAHLVLPPYPPNLVAQVAGDREGLYLIRRPAFGDEPRALLELRTQLPARSVMTVALPELEWPEAKADLLKRLPYEQAAHLYLTTQGNPGFVRDALEGLPPGESRFPGGTPRLSPRSLAQIQAESRFLSLEARLALEQLSVHPGHFPTRVPEALGIGQHLDELERYGWLVYDFGQWRFAHESARQALCASLQMGRRTRAHERFAEVFAELALTAPARSASAVIAETYHRQNAGQPAPLSPLRELLDAWGQDAVVTLEPPRHARGLDGALPPAPRQHPPTLHTPAVCGDEHPIMLDRIFGSDVQVSDNALFWHRRHASAGSGIEWQTPNLPTLLRLTGHAHVINTLGVGGSGRATPLELTVFAPHPVTAKFGGQVPYAATAYGLNAPLPSRFDLWLRLPANAVAQLSSHAELALIECDIRMYEAQDGRSENSVDVLDLCALRDLSAEPLGLEPGLVARAEVGSD